MRNCVTKCAAFRGFAQPSFILPMKCCDSFSGVNAHDQVLKGGTRTGFYHYCQRIRFGPTVKPLRSHPSTVSRRVGRLATHQNLAAFRIDSVHAWLAQKERKPAANVPLFWPTAQTRFLETVTSSSKQTCRAVPTSGLLVIRPELSAAVLARRIRRTETESIVGFDRH